MIEEIALSRFVPDIANEYLYVYAPTHSLATKSGKVMMHRYVMALSIGRPLLRQEAVHHKDENKQNNSIENLEILSSSDHARLHMEERYGAVPIVECTTCGVSFRCYRSRTLKTKSGSLFCGAACNKEHLKRFDVSIEELRSLVWSEPTTHVAARFGVSDSAVSKRCKSLGIEKPPRGYWSRLSAK